MAAGPARRRGARRRPPDVVVDGENGALYDPDQPCEAAGAIRRILEHEGERRFLARLARKTAEGASWAAETRRLLDAYRRAIVVARQSRGTCGAWERCSSRERRRRAAPRGFPARAPRVRARARGSAASPPGLRRRTSR